MESFAPYLDIAIRAARTAGDLLRADFHRPSGPRGEKDKAPADTEAEQIIRGILLGANSDWGFLGEETGVVPGATGAPVWVVDPNDGTRDYIKGRRGSSVSIALVADRRPVIGVVYPFGYPDDDGVMFSAAVGRECVWKNGAPVPASLKMKTGLTETDVVLVSGGGDRASHANLMCTKPARVMSIPSIAHRMALVAAGEATATTSLYSPRTWDFAAGHCLVLAAGGVVVDQYGHEPVYQDDGDGSATRLFVGARAVAMDLSTRNWDLAFRSERETAMPIVRLRKGAAVSDSLLLGRAQGAFLGHLVGSAVATAFDATHPNPEVDRFTTSSLANAAQLRRMTAGQTGSAGELAIATARSLVNHASDSSSLKKLHAAWVESAPAQSDHAIAAAVSGRPLSDSVSTMALARVTPFAIWGHETEPVILATTVRADTALTHPSPIVGDAAAVLAILIQALLHKKDALLAIDLAHAFARRSALSREVIDAIAQAAVSPGDSAGPSGPNAPAALQFTVFQLAHAPTFESAMESALDIHSMSDALPSILGGVMGARFGRDAVPARIRQLVMSSRPFEGLAPRPRPPEYWATDAMAIAEALLTAR
ncbi:MAG: inositol monophosphatase family protein [Vicinamibacteria bacterium]